MNTEFCRIQGNVGVYGRIQVLASFQSWARDWVKLPRVFRRQRKNLKRN